MQTLVDVGMLMMANGNKIHRITAYFLLVLFSTSLGSPALAGYTPAEMNMLLGTPTLMDAATCQKKYGANFCACFELEQGGYGCYYKKPAAGFYSLAKCEEIWGTGSCECIKENQCKLKSDENSGIPVGCNGQIFIFPGLKDECQKAGILTHGENCCATVDDTSQSCGFENLAKELGWDDAAISMVTSIGGYFAEEAIANWAAEYTVQKAMETGIYSSTANSLNNLLGDTTVKYLGEGMFEMTTSEVTTTATAEVVAEELAAVYMQAISIVGWVYTMYTLYNMYMELTECKPAESILRCKRAKGVCHKVGSKCAVKVFDGCLQKKEIFCCYDSVLARIVQEQGRTQLGRGWGDASSPECRGFYLNEFTQIDFSKIDMSEYGDDLARQMLNTDQIEDKVKDALDKWQNE